ncbi:MAG: sensor histidine kinase [Sphingobacteriales bacterium]|nr:MAG: sensor histidine kinase [Sphingobacteriales bacterium]
MNTIRRVLLPVLFICSFFLTAQAQLPALQLQPINVANIKDQLFCGGIAHVYKDSNYTATFANFKQLPWFQLKKNSVKILSDKDVTCRWIFKLKLTNTEDSAVKIVFFPGVYYTTINLYKQDSLGQSIQPLPCIMPKFKDSIGYRSFYVPAHDTTDYYFELVPARTTVNGLEIRLVRDYALNTYVRNQKIPVTHATMYSYIIVGILLIMIIYSLALNIVNKRVEFIYYASFALFIGLLFFLKSYYFKTTISFVYFFETYLDFVIQCLGTLFYFVFIRKFIEAKTQFRFLHYVFVINQGIIIAGLILFTLAYYMPLSFIYQNRVETLVKYSWSLGTILFIIYSLFHNKRILNILAIGHFLFLLAGITSLILISNPTLFGSGPTIWRDALFLYELGLTIELIFFLAALSLKNRKDIIERTKEQERLRLENERKEFEKQLAVVAAKQEERNRISADMHDELGSGVTAIRLMSEIVKTKMKDSTLPEIDKISNSANELLSKMNTIIWTMSSSNDKLDNMVAYIRAFALEFFESTNIDCHFKNPDQIPAVEISGEKRRNIFLCIKESLNNTAKHSKANDVWIDVVVRISKIEITIKDNGVGIDLQKLREFGNGLNNMRKRMQSIDGTFEIINNGGTITTFTVPL